MARSRNYGCSNRERRKQIFKKDRKSKHEPKRTDLRVDVFQLSVYDALSLMRSQELVKRHLKGGWPLDLYKLYRKIENEKNQNIRVCFRETIYRIEEMGFDLQNEQTLVMICNIAMHSEQIIHPVKKWKPECDERNVNDQLSDLITYCFTFYEVPAFLNRVWRYKSMKQAREWYLKLTHGGSLRELEGAPIPVTKKMAHQLRQASEHLDVDSAFRWAQVKSMGANDELTTAILRSHLGRNKFRNEEYWKPVMEWMIRQNCPSAFVNDLIDWLYNSQYGADQISLQGRTLASAQRLSAAWHEEVAQQRMARMYPVTDLEWNACAVADWKLVPVQEVKVREYHIIQLCSSVELRKESQQMRHCVASYASRCNQGMSAIFSLREFIAGQELATTLATIEIVPRSRTVVQVRAIANASPSDQSWKIIRTWINDRNLKMN